MQYEKIGKYIQIRRKKAGLSLNEFSIKNDIEPAILSRIENLKQGVKLNILVKIAQGFEETPAQFLSDFENEKL